MITETFTFNSSDGKQIFTHKWLPDDVSDLKAVIQISHGMAEHSARYERFAQRLTENNFAVYANDHRGHGQTEGSVENLGNYADKNGWEMVVNDMRLLTEKIKTDQPGVPVFIFAHSMGSFIARDYMFTCCEDIQGVVLSGTGGDPGLLGNAGILISGIESRLRGKKALSKTMDKLSFGSFNKAFKPNRTDFDWLSSDNEEVDKYVNDPYCGTIFTAGFFSDLLKGIKKINQFSNIKNIPKDLPVYLFSGANDPVGDYTKGVKQVHKSYNKAGIQDLSIKFYENGRHEMLNEVNREEVFTDVINWFNSHLPES